MGKRIWQLQKQKGLRALKDPFKIPQGQRGLLTPDKKCHDALEMTFKVSQDD